MMYNGENNVWMAENVTLTDGEIKFRLNNTWGGDYGGNDGQLGSDNIPVSAGTYTITVDFANGTYTIE